MFREEMTLKAAEAIKMVLDGGTACIANGTYHVHPHTGDTWHYTLPGEDRMESRAPLPECERQGAGISALARVAEELVRETGGVEHEKWAVGAIRRARYRRGEWMTREDTKAIFRVATKGPAAAQWRGQAVHIILPDAGWEAGGWWKSRYATCKGQGTSTMCWSQTWWSPWQRRRVWRSGLDSAGRDRRYRCTPWDTERDSRKSSGWRSPRGGSCCIPRARWG